MLGDAVGMEKRSIGHKAEMEGRKVFEFGQAFHAGESVPKARAAWHSAGVSHESGPHRRYGGSLVPSPSDLLRTVIADQTPFILKGWQR